MEATLMKEVVRVCKSLLRNLGEVRKQLCFVLGAWEDERQLRQFLRLFYSWSLVLR